MMEEKLEIEKLNEPIKAIREEELRLLQKVLGNGSTVFDSFIRVPMCKAKSKITVSKWKNQE